MKKTLLLLCLLLLAQLGLWAKPYRDNRDSTVTDLNTGLTWDQRQTGPLKWSKAAEHCKNLELGSQTDWRLPSLQELENLAEKDRGLPSLDLAYFPGTLPAFYWSGTAKGNANHYAYSFGYNLPNLFGRTATAYVRCVRGK